MWEAVLADMRELETNLAQARKERDSKGSDCPPTLVAFLEKCEKRIAHLQSQCKTATVGAHIYFLNMSLSSKSYRKNTDFI